MEDNKVLVLDNLSVRYRKANSRATADIVKRIFKKSSRSDEFWALRNVSLKREICWALSAKTVPENPP